MRPLAIDLFCGAAILATSPAAADSPDICRPYATQSTQLAMNFMWERFYNRCLVQDEVPLPPENPLDALKAAIPDPTIVPDAAPSSGEGNVTGKIIPPKGMTQAATPAAPTVICGRIHRRVVWQADGKRWNCK